MGIRNMGPMGLSTERLLVGHYFLEWRSVSSEISLVGSEAHSFGASDADGVARRRALTGALG